MASLLVSFLTILPPTANPPATDPGPFLEDVEVHYILEAEQSGEQFGWIARPCGDLDEDGVTDFLVTAPTWGDQGQGRLVTCSGADGSRLWQFEGEAGDSLGQDADSCGDVDEDGIPDLIVGAPGGNRAYVLGGADGGLLLDLEGDAPGEQFGFQVAGGSDLDGDEIPDLVISAVGCQGGRGRVALRSGVDGSPLGELTGQAAGDQFGSALDLAGSRLVIGAMGRGGTGWAGVFRWHEGKGQPEFEFAPGKGAANLGQYFVSWVGDVNADGHLDAFAADFAASEGQSGVGRVQVHSGRDGAHLFTLHGTEAGENLGTSTGVAGDVNGDGHDDLILGAWQNSRGGGSAGRCYLYSGRDQKLLATFTARRPGDTLGFDAVGMGDVSGDGRADLLLTSAWSTVRGPRSGRVFVVTALPSGSEPAPDPQ